MSKDNQKILCFIDFLQIRGKIDDERLLNVELGSIVHLSKSVKLEVKSYGHKFYERIADVYISGAKVAQLDWGYRIGVGGANIASLKIENSIFYTDANLADRVRSIFKSLSFEMQHVTRLDIALDGAKLHSYIDKVINKQLVSCARGGLTAYIDREDGVDGFSWGSRSYRYLRYYNKTKQLESLKGAKTYIEKIYEKEGMDDTVHRLEFELKHAYLKTVKDFDLFDILEDGESIYTLLKTVSKGFFGFKDTNGQKNASRHTVVFDITNIIGYVQKTFQRVYHRIDDGVYRAKLALRSLFDLGSWGNGNRVSAAIGAIVTNYPLSNYLGKVLPKWQKELEKIEELGVRAFDRTFVDSVYRFAT